MIRPFGLLVLLGGVSFCSPPEWTPTLAEIAAEEVQVVDLGWALNEENPYWPGDGYSPFHFETLATLEEDGVNSGAFSTAEHLGTHLDAPNHFEAGQPSVDQILLADLVAPLVVIDIREACGTNSDYRLSVEDPQEWEREFGRILPRSVVFALTGWGQYWNEYDRYKTPTPWENSISRDSQLRLPAFWWKRGRSRESASTP